MIDDRSPPQRQLSPLKFHLLWAAALLPLVALIGFTEAIGPDDAGATFQPWAVFAILAFSLVYSLVWWRRLDEAAREAHKWAWFWGANTGAVGALTLLMLGDRGVGAVEKIGFDNTLADGMALVLLFEILAYGVGWGFWWLRRR